MEKRNGLPGKLDNAGSVRNWRSRDDYIMHILHMKTLDADYARYALMAYHKELPEMDLVNGVREALQA